MKDTPTRILIVDDERDFTFMTALTLKAAGPYEIREENLATRVLDVAREFKPHLILLDVMMPEMDGGDVAAQLHGDPATRDIPVVFLTALVGKGESAGGPIASGGRRFLPKPVSVDALTACIEETMANAAATIAVS